MLKCDIILSISEQLFIEQLLLQMVIITNSLALIEIIDWSANINQGVDSIQNPSFLKSNSISLLFVSIFKTIGINVHGNE